MLESAEMQDSFAAALLDPEMGVPRPIKGATRRASQRRFAVYRNNVAASLVTALAERFPVVSRLVGDEFFRAMARVYATAELPRSPVLMQYGDTFPRFLDSFEPAASIPYLADIARLEFARGQAYHAADARPLDASEFASFDTAVMAELGVTLHPSVSIVRSGHPIVSIWEAHRDIRVIVPVQAWKAEAALVARPDDTVTVWRLPSGGFEFLQALGSDQSIAEAIDTARSADANFDLAANITVLIGSRIVIGVGNRGS